MFWMLVGVLCGVALAQEFPGLPRLRTTISEWYAASQNPPKDTK